jgi:hypothetical protein
MSKQTIYRLEVCRAPKGEQVAAFDSTTPFQALHANETIGLDGQVFRIKNVHHVVHETEHDILHGVTVSCEAV